MPLLYEELTRKILDACFEVSNELGAGFLESVYQNALTYTLTERGIPIKPQCPIDVFYKGNKVGHYVADFLVDEKVIIEIKASTGLVPEHSAQVINYLKATGIEVGLLVNFGKPKIEFRRVHK